MIAVNLIRNKFFPMVSSIASHDKKLSIKNHHTKPSFVWPRHRWKSSLLLIQAPQHLPTASISACFSGQDINPLFNLPNLLADGDEFSAPNECHPPL